jgi:hypothetical protein
MASNGNCFWMLLVQFHLAHQKWNAQGCDSFMYRVFQDEHPTWTERITKDTLLGQKPFWIATPQNQ